MTQTTRNNGPARPSRATLDPDYRRRAEPAAYWPLPPGQELTVCSRCSAVIPASERAKDRHGTHHEQLAGLEDGRPR